MDLTGYSDEKLRAVLTMEADDPELDPEEFRAATVELCRRLKDTSQGE